MDVFWSAEASGHLQDHVASLGLFSEVAANRLARRIREATDRLADFPYSGRAMPEFEGAILREVIVERFRVIYEVRQAVTIVAVHPGEIPIVDRAPDDSA